MEERKKAIYNGIRNDARSRGKKVEFISISKLDKYIKCKMEFKLSYIDKVKTEFEDSIINETGTLAHDILEKGVVERLDKDSVYSSYAMEQDKLLEKYGLDRTLPLYQSVSHFFRHSNFIEKLQGLKVEFEKSVVMKLPYNDPSKPDLEYWFVGFIDLLMYNTDGTVTILDFKTSNISGYTGVKLKQALKQLYAYGYILENSTELKVKEVGYLFIKYCNLTFKDSKGKLRKSSKVERRTIDSELEKKDYREELTMEDTVVMFDFTDELKKDYMKSIVKTFIETKKTHPFNMTGEGRDTYYCEHFCQFKKSGVCTYQDPIVQEENPMVAMLNIYMAKSEVN